MFNDFYFFEKNYFNYNSVNFNENIRDKNINDFYNFLNNKETLAIIENYTNILYKNSSKLTFKRKLEIYSSNLIFNKEISFINFKYFDNKTHLLCGFISIFIFKALSTQSKLNPTHESLLLKKEKSFTNSDEIINRISADLNKMLIWSEIISKNKISNINSSGTRMLVFESLLFLKDENIISIENIISTSSKKTIITTTHIYSTKTLPLFDYIDINQEEFMIYEKNLNESYIYNNHFMKIFSIFKENTESGETFKISASSKIISNLLKNWIYIDTGELKKILEESLNFWKIKNLDESFLLLTEKLKTKIKTKDNIGVSTIAKELSRIQNLLKIRKITEQDLKNIKIFLPFRFDFRGRLYMIGDISPTHNKEFRFCLNKGVYETTDMKEHTFNKLIINELEKYYYLLEKIDENYISKPESIKQSLIWMLISLAEIQKKELGKTIQTKEFIEKGIKIYLNKELEIKLDLTDKIKTNYIIMIINQIKNEIYIKWLISKDATASCYQHLIKILGGAGEESKKWCNMQSYDTWYDTYMFIIEEINNHNLKKIKFLSINSYILIFNRKNLKKTIMTYNYGASLRTCWEYFQEEIDISLYTRDQNQEIEKFFIIFYNYLNEENTILKNSSEKITEYFIKDNEYIILMEKLGTVVNLLYKKTHTTQIEIRHNGKRYTKKHHNLESNINKKKIKSATRANYVHTLDAALVHWFIQSESNITIHDCFMTDYINTTYLVSKINEGMRIVFHDLKIDQSIDIDNLFSIYIIL